MSKAPGTEAGISLTGETFRKLTHVFALIMPLVAWTFGVVVALTIMIPLTLCAVGADYFRVRSPRFKLFIERFFGSMMRSHELPAVGEPVILNGATWTFMAFTLLLLTFETGIVVTMFSVCMIGDGAAAMIGRRIGHHKWGRSGCSVEGSAAYFVFGFATALLIGGGGIIPVAPYSFPLLALGVGTTVGALAEIVPWPIDDNLAAPVGAAASMALVLQFGYGIPLEYFSAF
ncbi:MAG: hypothetical protein BMS9Abin05_0836 [Rhodothermia bacterium]|nr:MAG: hypothetical protein BMS9Abin05_0836 [Rhodothermia bacterium]